MIVVHVEQRIVKFPLTDCIRGARIWFIHMNLSSPDFDLSGLFRKSVSHIFDFEKPNVRHINLGSNPNRMYLRKSHALV